MDRHYACADCKDSEHTCLAWDGKGRCTTDGYKPNHNLVEECPEDVTSCEYCMPKIPSGL
jgi:hypothetical protein